MHPFLSPVRIEIMNALTERTMKIYSSKFVKKQARNGLAGVIWLIVGITITALSALTLAAQNQVKHGSGKSAGFVFSDEAKEKDLGVPIYPGSRQHKDKDDETSALNVGLWGGSSGFKLVVLKLDSRDSPGTIAVFYHKALSRYGTVLECGKSGAEKKEKNGEERSRGLSCEDDQPEKGGLTLKAGTKEKMHLVGIEPNGKGTVISLVYVEAPKSRQ